MLPKIVTGSSAGTLAACIISTRTDEELKNEMLLTENIKPHVNAMHGTWFQRFYRLITKGSLFDCEIWREELMFFSNGNMTFREAHDRTGRILNICVVSADGGHAKVLNYITAPDVLLNSAM